MNEIKEKERVAKDIVASESSFKGYTIEEIKFQRALTAMEADFCKSKFFKHLNNLQKANPLSPSSNASLPSKVGAVGLKLLNGLNYVDYALLGFSLFSGVRKVLGFFKKTKKH